MTIFQYIKKRIRKITYASGKHVPFSSFIGLNLFIFVISINPSFAVPQPPVSFEKAVTEFPLLLDGIWENGNRLIAFGKTETSVGLFPLIVVLKTFYGWYYDRVAEPASQNLPERDRNAASSNTAERITVSFEPLIQETTDSGAWNMVVSYPGEKQPVYIPIAVFNGALYLDFLIASALDSVTTDDVFWKAASHSASIGINLPVTANEVYSLYRSGNTVYRIRYWKTDMAYDKNAFALLNDGGMTYSVPKLLSIGADVYTCVPGLGVQIRNADKIPYDFSKYAVSADGRICAGKPYAVLSKINDMYSEIEKANLRRKPLRKPPLPDSELDFHYEIIEELRKYAIGQ